MAENPEAEAAGGAHSSPGGGSGGKPILFIALSVINMVVVAGVGGMIYLGRLKEAKNPTIEHVVQGEAEAQHAEAADAEKDQNFIGKVIPLETFVVNLAGSRGRRIAKINIELELEGDRVYEEIDKRKAQVRDIILILLSSKTFEQVGTREGKDSLRDEIRDTVNAFLTKGKIRRVYFTDFIYNS